MTPYEKHKEVHVKLHQNLDELVADFIRHTKSFPSETTILELILWSADETINPTT